MKIPSNLFNQFIAFNNRGGYKAYGSNKGIELHKPKCKSLFVSNSNELNDEATKRYMLMLELWFKQGKSFIDDLKKVEVKRTYKMVA